MALANTGPFSPRRVLGEANYSANINKKKTDTLGISLFRSIVASIANTTHFNFLFNARENRDCVLGYAIKILAILFL